MPDCFNAKKTVLHIYPEPQGKCPIFLGQPGGELKVVQGITKICKVHCAGCGGIDLTLIPFPEDGSDC